MSIITGSNTIIKENLLAQESTRLLDKEFIVAPFANTKYEWQIKQRGDTVSIETFPRIAWQSATTAGATISVSDFVITKDQLVITELRTFGARHGSLEDIQENLPLATKIAEQMTYGQADEIEKFIIKTIVAGAHTDNVLWDITVALTKSDVHAAVEKIAVALKEKDVKIADTVLFVKPALASLIRQSSLFEGFKEGLDVRRKGFVGRISSMEIYETTNIGYKCMIAMDRDSVHFAAQWTGMKDEEVNGAFAKQYLGEMAFGAKVCTENKKRIALYYSNN